jgi:hypothetical protein
MHGVNIKITKDQVWIQDVYHPSPCHAPVAANTVFSTPDDGHRKRPKHVILQLLINILPKLHLVGPLYNMSVLTCDEK